MALKVNRTFMVSGILFLHAQRLISDSCMIENPILAGL